MVGKMILVLDENTASCNFLPISCAKNNHGHRCQLGQGSMIVAWRDGPGLDPFRPRLSDIRIRIILKLRNNREQVERIDRDLQ